MAILSVGAGQQFTTLASAVAASQDGDTIQLQAGTYTNDFAEINKKITVEGVGGVAKLVATESIPNGKAILVTDTDVTLENLEFSGATVSDNNGAGVRYQGGNLTVINSYFHNNQNGLLAAPNPSGSVTIENSEFADNGIGDGYTHNLYIGDVGSLTVENSYFHDAVVGHEIKSRAENNTIIGNRIEDGATGDASYEIDIANGGNADIEGNVIEKGPNAQNPIMISYGEEGSLHAGTSLTVSGNTMLNDAGSSTIAVKNATGASANVTGNSIYNVSSSNVLWGTGAVSGTTALSSEPALDTSSPSAAPAGNSVGSATGSVSASGGTPSSQNSTAQNSPAQNSTPATGAGSSGNPSDGSTRAPIDSTTVYRFLSTSNGEHFYTASTAERNTLIATRSDLQYEGVGMNAANAATDPNAAPVYRFLDTANGSHFFTSSASEMQSVMATRSDMHYEGIAYDEHTTQQAGDTAVYRFLDTENGSHFYTASATESASVSASRPDMHYEGVAFYTPSHA